MSVHNEIQPLTTENKKCLNFADAAHAIGIHRARGRLASPPSRFQVLSRNHGLQDKNLGVAWGRG